MEYRSKINLEGMDKGLARSLFKSMGYSDDDLTDRPIIGIANSWSTLVPGHFNLNQLSDFVKKGIYRSGGTAVEFGVISACDGIANGHEGMKYILPSREIICNSIEIEAQAHKLDGLIMLGSCDKIIPGMLMAAARLNIPTIIVNGGPMIGGVVFDGRKSDATSTDEALGMYKAGKIEKSDLKKLEDSSCPSCGSCAFLGTANTVGCMAEALGMSLTGSALIPATYSERLRIAFDSGLKICELVEKDLKPRDIMTKEAIRNAVKVILSMSGSTNAVLHLSAIAYEADLDINIVTPDSWDLLWDENYSGQILMMDSQRDSFAAALKKLGYSLNTTNETELEEAKNLLINQKPLVMAYIVDEALDMMIADEAAISLIWSGEAVAAMGENEKLNYYVPKEGSNI
ncbi:MAG: dihydroxy-acid dehydratase, partial [Tissierellales bacterium]|nr:dihydroxy-acid dehydratase [Tissierellales bacterium]